MGKRGKNSISTFILFMVFQALVFGQSKGDFKSFSGGKIEFNKQSLKRLKKKNKKKYKQNHKAAIQLAEERGWPLRKKLYDGRLLELQGIDKAGNPVYYITFSLRGAATTGTEDVWEGGDMGLSLDGGSDNINNRLGVWDAGPVRTSHQEFDGRVDQQDNAGSSYDDHATHVSGIMVGGGVNANAKGMAFESNLKAWDWDNDISEMSEAAADGLLLSNHSYGLGYVGWVYNSDRSGDVKWEWWGDTDIDDYEDYRFGYYDDYAQEVDEVANNAPYYLVVVAAGNNGGYNGPESGNSYYLRSTNQTSTLERRSQDSFDLLSSFGLSKNILTVGAIYPLINGFQNASQVDIADFSSLGPADDGRIKPDVVGDGVNVLSTIATSNQAYDSYNGTSMAAPNVTGSLQLLQEYFAELNQGNFLRSATLKGLAIHTADDAGNAGPDYTFGWGVLNTGRAAQVIENTNNNYLINENSLSQGQADTLEVIASGTEALRFTIAWNDPAATPLDINAAVVNNRSPLLVNDLDIRVANGSTTILPWKLDPDQPERPAERGNNVVDNVEQIVIEEPVPGEIYQLVVSHKGNLQNGTQDYSLIVSGMGGDLYCESGAEEETGAKIAEVQFGSIDYTASPECSSYTNQTNSFSEIPIRSDNPLELNVSLVSCDDPANTIIKAFIDWNADFDFDDENELVATSGVINSNGEFNVSIELPDNLVANTFTRLRIVCVETSDDNEVLSCGTYQNGETLDYSIKFISPSYDVLPTALLSPDEVSCSGFGQKMTLKVKNIGKEEISGFPVQIMVTNDINSDSLTFTTDVNETILPQEESLFTFPEQIELLPNVSYRFQVNTLLGQDEYHSNDTLRVSFVSAGSVSPPLAEAYICDDENISLLSDDEETVFWYSSSDGTIPLGTGNAILTNELPEDSIYYAAVNDFQASLGPISKYEFDGGSYGAGFVPQPVVETEVPLVIDSARMYIGHSGKLTFSVLEMDGTVVSTSEVNVEATRSTVVSGDSDDDLTDEGKMFAIGLEIPEPGRYLIQMDYADDVSVFRSNEGVSGFPFDIPGIISLRGALYEGDTLTGAYYYLYDIRLRSMGCKSERVPVKAIPGLQISTSISTEDSLTQCNSTVFLEAENYENAIYQWQRDGSIVGETSEGAFEASVSGSYNVIISNEQCTYSPSNEIEVGITNIEKPAIQLEGETIVSSSHSGNQWYLDGEVIEDATDNDFEAEVSGYYFVKVSENSCEVHSDSLFVYVEPPVSDGLWLYPNPVDDVLTVRFRQEPTGNSMYLEIYDLLGKEVAEKPLTYLFEDIYETLVNVTGLPTGVYMLKVSQGRRIWTERFIKN